MDDSNRPRDFDRLGGVTDAVQHLDHPELWREMDRRGAGPFVTWITYRRPDGLLVRWESREQRKHHNHLDRGRGSTWWAPGAVAWWIDVLFPDSGQPRHAELVNLGTFVGALGFLIGAFLLLPERTDSPGPVVAPIPTS